MPSSSVQAPRTTPARLATAFACALATGLAGPAALAQQTDPGRERCFGAALTGENDGIGKAEVPGGSMRDYQGDAWIWMDAGECLILPLPPRTDGTPRRAAPEPIDRDRGSGDRPPLSRSAAADRP